MFIFAQSFGLRQTNYVAVGVLDAGNEVSSTDIRRGFVFRDTIGENDKVVAIDLVADPTHLELLEVDLPDWDAEAYEES